MITLKGPLKGRCREEFKAEGGGMTYMPPTETIQIIGGDITFSETVYGINHEEIHNILYNVEGLEACVCYDNLDDDSELILKIGNDTETSLLTLLLGMRKSLRKALTKSTGTKTK